MMGLCVHEGTKVRQTSDNHKGVMRSGKKKKKYLIGVYYASVAVCPKVQKPSKDNQHALK